MASAPAAAPMAIGNLLPAIDTPAEIVASHAPPLVSTTATSTLSSMPTPNSGPYPQAPRALLFQPAVCSGVTADKSDPRARAAIHTSDGRVKNPVPSKLKGKADNKNGNFGVMHIDLNSSQAALRNAAAKRTSEGTEAAAKLANMNGYQSIKRSKLAWNPPPDSLSHTTIAAPSGLHNVGLLKLLPHDVKAEQARLLTLLRTLHPVVVVDQLCKALAYFGGIPGAPPPISESLPESAKNNGQGSLFISWIAEIFPPVDSGGSGAPMPHPSLQYLPPPLTPSAANSTVPITGTATTPTSVPSMKRSRGRPKGSKTSKNKNTDAGDPPLTDTSVNATDRPQAILANPLGPVDTPRQVDPDSSMLSTSGAKKRGRPKGSKNRPKATPESGATQPGPGSQPADSAQPPPVSPTTSNHINLPNILIPGSQAIILSEQQQSPTSTTLTFVSEQANLARTHHTPSSEPMRPHTSQWPSVGIQTSERGQQTPKAKEKGAVRKRKVAEPVPNCDIVSTMVSNNKSPQLQQEDNTMARGTVPEQPANGKRRRVSKGATQNPNFSNMESHPPSIGIAASPTLTVANNTVTQIHATSQSLEHQPSGIRQSHTRKSPPQHFQQPKTSLPQLQPLHHKNQPQKHYQFNSPQQPQQSVSSLHQTSQQQRHQHQQRHQSQGLSTPSGPPGPRSQAPAYGRPQSNMPSQEYYSQQRAIPDQVGQDNSSASGFGRDSGVSRPQFTQHAQKRSSGDGEAVTISQQNPMVPVGGQHIHDDASRQTSSFTNPHVPSASAPPTNVSQFQTYEEHSYLDMDYGLNERDVQDSATALGDPAQLEVVLGEPTMRERLYQTIGRR